MELRSGVVKQQRTPLPPAAKSAFEEGARFTFRRWTALCLAVEQQWGGSGSAEKANWMLQESINWFYGSKEHFWDELADELEDALLQDFNMEAEDGSPEEIAKSLVGLFQECAREDYSTVLRLRAQEAANQSSGAAASRRQVVDNDGTVMGEGADDSSSGEDNSEDEDDTAMDDRPPGGVAVQPRIPHAPQVPVVDEDGFTLVQKPKRAGARK